MQLKRRKPCNECPFLKSAPKGFLGGNTPEHLQRVAHAETGVHCHKENGKSHLKKLTDEKFFEKAHVCVGSLIHANMSHKLYRNEELRKFQELVPQRSKYILDFRNFIPHHTIIKKVKNES